MRTMTTKDKIRGCMLGGAVGDALGWPVEFRGEGEIFRRWGPGGITEYDLNGAGEAEITDDTQMALFTANGILYGETHPEMPIRNAAAIAYQDWLYTQEGDGGRVKPGGICWLNGVPGLYHRRAPGGTCLSALRAQNKRPGAVENYIDAELTDSKGCGSIMRVAPMGLRRWDDIEALDYEGAQLGAVTHGHPLGYMPCAVLTHIVNRLVYPEGAGMALEDIVLEARDAVANIFEGSPYLKRLCELIDRAMALARSDGSDLENIHALGEGWVADEALAIALYCALKYQHDFSAGIIASVNHKGDSDSTGAITGNILGALTGFDAIDGKWKKNLELYDTLLEIADDLADERPAEAKRADPDWAGKYRV